MFFMPRGVKNSLFGLAEAIALPRPVHRERLSAVFVAFRQQRRQRRQELQGPVAAWVAHSPNASARRRFQRQPLEPPEPSREVIDSALYLRGSTGTRRMRG